MKNCILSQIFQEVDGTFDIESYSDEIINDD
jgi:hypothetical protein